MDRNRGSWMEFDTEAVAKDDVLSALRFFFSALFLFRCKSKPNNLAHAQVEVLTSHHGRDEVHGKSICSKSGVTGDWCIQIIGAIT